MRFLPAVVLVSLSCLLVCSPIAAQESQSPAPDEAQKAPNRPLIGRIRIGGSVATAKLLNKIQPVYPPLARAARISGTVRLHAIISTEGTVKSLEVISGHPLLQQSSLDAVHQWRYEPTLLNGEPVEVDTTIDVIYALDQNNVTSSSSAAAIDSQRRANILRLFEVIHFKDNATKGGRQIFESLRPALKASIPDTPNRERITDAYIEKLLALVNSDVYTERVIASYAKYFSDEDIRELIRFYQTPTGQHFNAAQPELLGELSAIGQQIATQNLPDILRQLCKEFPELQDDGRFCKEPDPQQKSQMTAPTRPFDALVRNADGRSD